MITIEVRSFPITGDVVVTIGKPNMETLCLDGKGDDLNLYAVLFEVLGRVIDDD